MCDTAYVVAPIGAGGSRQGAVQAAQAIASQRDGINGQDNLSRKEYLHRQDITDHRSQLHSNADYGIQGKAGPLKQTIGKTDSLYKYLNWEEPSRTISSYIGALAFLSGLHYFPLTQLALKASAIVFGIMSVASFVTRSFNTKTAGRLAPREYKRIPEDTLNATLKDVHDFVQYAVVQVQRIVLGEDLNKTFAAFVGSTALYWLIKVVSAFGLSVIGLTSVYLATLLTSPRGREAALDASARAGEIANTAARSGKQIAQDGANQAAAFSSKARDTVTDVGRRSLDTAGSNIQSAKKQAKRAAGNAQGTSQSATGYARDTEQSATRRTGDTVQSGKESVGSSSHGTGRGLELSGSHPSTVKDLPRVTDSSINRDLQDTRSSLQDTTRNSNNASSRYNTQDSSLNDLISNTNRVSDTLSTSQSGSYNSHDYTHIPNSNATDQSLHGNSTIGSTLGFAAKTPRSANDINDAYDARFDETDSQGPEPTGAVNTAFPTTINSTNL